MREFGKGARTPEQQHRRDAQHCQTGDQPKPIISTCQTGQGADHSGKGASCRRKRKQSAKFALLLVGYAVARPCGERCQHHVERDLPKDEESNGLRDVLDEAEGGEKQARQRQPGGDPRAARSAEIACPAEQDVRPAGCDRARKGRVGKPGDILRARQGGHPHRQQQGQEGDIRDRAAGKGERVEP